MRVDKSKCKEITKVPNIKSAKKRVLVNQKKNEQNKMIKNEVKTAIKKIDLLVKEGKLDDAKPRSIACDKNIKRILSEVAFCNLFAITKHK